MSSQYVMASTRESYGRTLVELGHDNPNIVVVGGDLNKSTFTHLFGQKFPNRFFDLGPAEQNIMGVAAGLAASGKTPFVSTFAVFGTGRPFDQIRINIAQSHLNVKIVCTHAGVSAGEDGMSAHGIEDLSLMCSLPGFTVIAPSDSVETAQAVRAAASTPGPFYIRLYRPPTPVVHTEQYNFTVGAVDIIRSGSDATIISTGALLATCLESAEDLGKLGLSCRVINMPTLKPTNEEAILKAANDTGAIVTVEEHYVHGGLGSIVAQTLGKGCPTPLEMVALTDYCESGNAQKLLEKSQLTAENIVETVKRVVARKG